MEHASAASAYAERRTARAAARARLDAAFRRIGNARLATVVVALVLAWAVFARHALPSWLLLVPLACFAGLVVWHERVVRARRRADRAVAFYDRGLDRLADRWAGAGEPGERFRDPHHPFADDLDLFGRGSLFELLCTARTRAGESTLARWLLAGAPPAEVRARQAAVTELRDRLDLREELFLEGEDLRAGLHPEALEAWAAAPPVPFPAAARAAVTFAVVVNAASLAASGAGAGAWPVLAAFAASGALALALRARVRRVVDGIERPLADLRLLAGVLARVERERLEAPRLRALGDELRVAGEPPSGQVARLAKLVDRLDARRNQLFLPVALVLFWATHHAFAIEGWRRRNGAAIPRWLAAVGEFEALSALSSHAYEHPADPFPEIVEAGPRFSGTGLGHPLLPEGRCVRNDVSFGDGRQLLVVSGSNMSGKSTLLRTVGTNAVLALAGAPVRAERLVLSPLALGATLRVQDSLQEGASRFYAEITRLADIVALASGGRPLLFLLDEILAGTNSHDRRIGAEAIVRGLVARGAIGLVTTHDLALAAIADALAPAAENVHFADHLEGGRIAFDYRVHPGVVTKSNALELMRAVGLEV